MVGSGELMARGHTGLSSALSSTKTGRQLLTVGLDEPIFFWCPHSSSLSYAACPSPSLPACLRAPWAGPVSPHPHEPRSEDPPTLWG